MWFFFCSFVSFSLFLSFYWWGVLDCHWVSPMSAVVLSCRLLPGHISIFEITSQVHLYRTWVLCVLFSSFLFSDLHVKMGHGVTPLSTRQTRVQSNAVAPPTPPAAPRQLYICNLFHDASYYGHERAVILAPVAVVAVPPLFFCFFLSSFLRLFRGTRYEPPENLVHEKVVAVLFFPFLCFPFWDVVRTRGEARLRLRDIQGADCPRSRSSRPPGWGGVFASFIVRCFPMTRTG